MDKTINFLNEYLDDQKIVVLGCSGGPDSMCLLDLLLQVKKSINFKLIVAHMNHKVRIESEEEKEFVSKVCHDNNINFEYYELDKNIKSNFHSEARIIRYQFFNRVIDKYNANVLMTAHHADDLMETILMRLGRGSTLKGYSGFDLITKKDGYDQIHPLIFYTKDEIKKYMDDNKLDYRIDNTNYEDDYLRNRYRHHILPLLKKEYNMIHEKYFKFSNTINEADNYIISVVNIKLDIMFKNNILDLDLFKKEDTYIQKRIIESIMNSIYIDNLYLVSDTNTSEIIKCIYNNKPNIIVNLPNNIKLVKEYNKLIVNKVINNSNINQEFDGYYEDDYIKISKLDESTDKSNYTIRLNSEEIKLPLIIRNRVNGDKMMIKNMSNYKKLKDILIDMKIPKYQRDQLLLLTDSDNNILWIPGLKKSKFDKEFDEKYDIILNIEMKEKYYE